MEECYSCGQLSQGYGKIGSHMGQASNVLEEQARATQRGVVEDLKRHRDLLVSVMELMQRRERAKESGLVETLKKRITNQEQKLTHLRTTAAATAAAAARAEGAGDGGYGGSEPGIYDAQIEKLVQNIQSVSRLCLTSYASCFWRSRVISEIIQCLTSPSSNPII